MSNYSNNGLEYFWTWHEPEKMPHRFKKVKSMTQPETYPKDFEKGWEHYRHFHLCYFCHEQGHEDEMIMYDFYYWAHKTCKENHEQFIKQLNHESENNQD